MVHYLLKDYTHCQHQKNMTLALLFNLYDICQNKLNSIPLLTRLIIMDRVGFEPTHDYSCSDNPGVEERQEHVIITCPPEHL
jgi:hypothetical protein